jgi:hypothetical protein
VQLAPDGRGELLRIAARPHHHTRLTQWRLHSGEKYRWLLIFRKA